jgi:hypothetical protein
MEKTGFRLRGANCLNNVGNGAYVGGNSGHKDTEIQRTEAKIKNSVTLYLCVSINCDFCDFCDL